MRQDSLDRGQGTPQLDANNLVGVASQLPDRDLPQLLIFEQAEEPLACVERQKEKLGRMRRVRNVFKKELAAGAAGITPRSMEKRDHFARRRGTKNLVKVDAIAQFELAPLDAPTDFRESTFGRVFLIGRPTRGIGGLESAARIAHQIGKEKLPEFRRRGIPRELSPSSNSRMHRVIEPV